MAQRQPEYAAAQTVDGSGWPPGVPVVCAAEQAAAFAASASSASRMLQNAAQASKAKDWPDLFRNKIASARSPHNLAF